MEQCPAFNGENIFAVIREYLTKFFRRIRIVRMVRMALVPSLRDIKKEILGGGGREGEYNTGQQEEGWLLRDCESKLPGSNRAFYARKRSG